MDYNDMNNQFPDSGDSRNEEDRLPTPQANRGRGYGNFGGSIPLASINASFRNYPHTTAEETPVFDSSPKINDSFSSPGDYPFPPIEDPIPSANEPAQDIPTRKPEKKKRTGLKIFLIILFACLGIGAVVAIVLVIMLALVFMGASNNALTSIIPNLGNSSVETTAPTYVAETDWYWDETEAATEEEEEWYEETEYYTNSSDYDYLEQLNQKYDNYFDFYPDEDGFVIANSDTYVISNYDLYGMTEHEVCIARNEIYARYGYIFKSEKYNDYFSNFSWYHPTTTIMPDVSDLNAAEAANVATIIAYENSRGW